MVNYQPEDGKWQLHCEAEYLWRIKQTTSPDEYESTRHNLQEFLCNYFSADDNCRVKQGSSVSPISSTAKGGKILKVRWAMPGGGKSGGLRLIVVAYCEQKRVVIADGLPRSQNPSPAWITEKTKSL